MSGHTRNNYCIEYPCPPVSIHSVPRFIANPARRDYGLLPVPAPSDLSRDTASNVWIPRYLLEVIPRKVSIRRLP